MGIFEITDVSIIFLYNFKDRNFIVVKTLETKNLKQKY